MKSQNRMIVKMVLLKELGHSEMREGLANKVRGDTQHCFRFIGLDMLLVLIKD